MKAKIQPGMNVNEARDAIAAVERANSLKTEGKRTPKIHRKGREKFIYASGPNAQFQRFAVNPGGENISRGIEVAWKVLETGQDEPKAMKCPALGGVWVEFRAGIEGQAPGRKTFKESTEQERRKAFKKGYGIRHIAAKRQWEGFSIEETFAAMAAAIGCGTVARKVTESATSNGEPVEVSQFHLLWAGFLVVISDAYHEGKEVKPGTWMVTGFELWGGAPEHSSRLQGYTPEGQFNNHPAGASQPKDTPRKKSSNPKPKGQTGPSGATAKKAGPQAGPMATTTRKTPARKAPKVARKNPAPPSTLGQDLESVWEKWTGAKASRAFEINLPGTHDVPTSVVLLGKVSKLITAAGKLKDFKDRGPLMVTDGDMTNVWLIHATGQKFDLDMSKGIICYLAKKPKFGDREPVEYVHQFAKAAHARMAGPVGTLTGSFRLTGRGIEG